MPETKRWADGAKLTKKSGKRLSNEEWERVIKTGSILQVEELYAGKKAADRKPRSALRLAAASLPELRKTAEFLTNETLRYPYPARS